mgnify:CR=1 FL=1
MTVIVTGASGYIGGQTLLHLRDLGHDVVGIDRREPSKVIRDAASDFFIGSCTLFHARNLIRDYRPDAVIHCAGTSLVGPSIADPREYYENNYYVTKELVDWVLEHSPRTRVVFSSSASVYGTPVMTPCHEVDPISPISPYGESKAMIEWLLASYARAYQLDYVSFRYFNACGADTQARRGQKPGATHLIARVLESVRDKKDFMLYGNNYPTADGSCVRDYIHVDDLAEAHILACSTDIPGGIYNLGSSTGHSNLEVVNRAAQVLQKDIPLLFGPRREGDPATLTADAGKFTQATGWRPKHSLDNIIQHAWAWYNR